MCDTNAELSESVSEKREFSVRGWGTEGGCKRARGRGANKTVSKDKTMCENFNTGT